MLRRLTWATAGAFVGFGVSKWLERKAKKRLKRYLPQGLRGLRAALRVAAKEGRRAMESRESELRGSLSLGANSGAACPGGNASTTLGTRSRPPQGARRWPQARRRVQGSQRAH
jgi:hypothetical protein